jgi:hypothetical protein
MQVSFGYSGQPKVYLTVVIPKLRTEEIPATRIWQTRAALLQILKEIPEEIKDSPNSFANEIFIQVKAKRDDIVLQSVVFTIVQEDGSETSLCFVGSDLPLPVKAAPSPPKSL